MGYVQFKAKKIILLVRNPFSAIESYFHMGMTNTHNKSLTPQAKESLECVWESFVVNEIQVWVDFHKYWLLQATNGAPVLLVRFEDLVCEKLECAQMIIDYMNLSKEAIAYGKRGIVCSSSDSSASGPRYIPRKVNNIPLNS